LLFGDIAISQDGEALDDVDLFYVLCLQNRKLMQIQLSERKNLHHLFRQYTDIQHHLPHHCISATGTINNNTTQHNMGTTVWEEEYANLCERKISSTIRIICTTNAYG
jgi:hypothetical protein